MNRTPLRNSRFVAEFITMFLSATLAGAQTLSGTVEGSGHGLAGANVRILELNRVAHTGADGAFKFAHVPAGTYRVFASLIGRASATQSVTVAGEGGTVTFDLKESAIPIEEVVVSATPDARTADEQYQSVESRSRADLMNAAGASIADKISDVPGVAVRGCGVAPTRPILRGLTDNRVLVLEDGQRTGDLATFDPAHATPIEGIAVSDVDVVRGPASILYGPSTIGGLVNVITDLVPGLADHAVSGTMSAEGNSVNNQAAGFLRTVISHGRNAFSVAAGGVHTEDVRIHKGDYYDAASDYTFALDKMPQSFNHSGEGGLGWSYTGTRGTFGLGAKHYEMNYGIPGDPAATDPSQPPASSSRIFQRRNTLEIEGAMDMDGGFFQRVKLNGAINDYRHAEYPLAQDPTTSLEVTDPEANHFHKKEYNATLLFQQKAENHLQGSLGVWANVEDMTIGGDMPLGPNSTTTGLAAFAYEEYVSSPQARFQAGVRFDDNRLQTNPDATSTDPVFQTLDTSRNSNAVTASLGAIRKFTPEVTGSVSVARSFRAPTVQELFAEGLDAPSASYMRGNPALDPETGLGVDASLKGKFDRFAFELSPYLNVISKYIYAYESGDTTIDSVDWPMLRFATADARLMGFEASATVQAAPHVALRGSADYVDARDTKADEPLPFTPPLRGLLRATYQTNAAMAMIEWRGAAAQTQLAPGETRTPGYGIVNLGVGVRVAKQGLVHSVSLHCDNALDRDYRDHTSVLKDFLPQPGRGFRLNYELNY